MTRILVLLFALAGLWPAGAFARTDSPAPLSLGSGYSVEQVVSGGPGIAVVQDGSGRVVWYRALPRAATRLDTPQPGVFRALVPASGDQPGLIVAERLVSGRVRSAIKGHRTGTVHGSEEVHFAGRRLVTVSPDSTHAGSVRYRLRTTFELKNGEYRRVSRIRQPDYPAGDFQPPSATVTTRHGDTILIRLEVAASPALRAEGLMWRTSLDPDSGMLFVWDVPTMESFWMQNTPIPLTVGFISSDFSLMETQDMVPFTTDLHTPAKPYQFALEVNQGFFAANGIRVGDRFTFHLTGG